MRFPFKRAAIVAGVVVVLIVGTQAEATKPFRPTVVKCNPNQCTPEQVCGQPGETPKVCGETKDGPFFPATYSCCCCTPDSKGRWFFGE